MRSDSSSKDRLCQECGSVLRGRIDQRFCDGYCRVAYHNRKKRFRGHMNSQKSQCQKNQEILDWLWQTRTNMIHIELLKALGYTELELLVENENKASVYNLREKENGFWEIERCGSAEVSDS